MRDIIVFAGKGGKCQYHHPKKCFFYLKYGPVTERNPDGCDQKRCCGYHPPLCQQSIRTLQCYNDKCMLAHLMDTDRKRKSDPWSDHIRLEKPNGSKLRKSKSSVKISAKVSHEINNVWKGQTSCNNCNTLTNNSPFLGQTASLNADMSLEGLKDQLQTILTRLGSMDMQIKEIRSSNQSYIQGTEARHSTSMHGRYWISWLTLIY